MDFQTSHDVCEFMASKVPSKSALSILEPTPGEGNLVSALKSKGSVTAPTEFFDLDFTRKWDYIVMNPPFTPMKLGYEILDQCLEMSDNIIALMPWLTMINSQKRTDKLMEYGLKNITHLPRSIFKGSRVQCCILELERGYQGVTEFVNYKR